MFPVILSTLANADIHDIVSYLDEQSFDAGDRFYDQVNRTLERLEQMPELGTVCHFGNTGAEIRVWPVRGFPNHLVFYRITPNVVTTILRVLHGSTNYEALFQR